MAFSWKSTQVPDETFVIIGNGFDVECGLHTKYGDFLEFVREMKYDDPSAGIIPTHPVNWQDLRDHNYWFKRFESVHIGSRWVDFETEIARVVTTVERDMLREDGSYAFIDDNAYRRTTKRGDPFVNEVLIPLSEAGATIQSYRELVDKLLDDLKVLTQCLEAYLYDYACYKNPIETAVIKGLLRGLGSGNSVSIISFNYTNTLERLLGEAGIDSEFCYVHGSIGDGKEKNRMVLGIDEHLDEDAVEKLVEFGPFRKYNQRIYKQTDSSYMNWLSDARAPYQSLKWLNEQDDRLLLSSGNSEDIGRVRERIAKQKDGLRKRVQHREVIVFGHSLGVTDKDILQSFITLPDTRTVVYYHDEESFSSQVSNLTAILGMDEVIARTGGSKRTLKFVNQHELA